MNEASRSGIQGRCLSSWVVPIVIAVLLRALVPAGCIVEAMPTGPHHAGFHASHLPDSPMARPHVPGERHVGGGCLYAHGAGHALPYLPCLSPVLTTLTWWRVEPAIGDQHEDLPLRSRPFATGPPNS